MPLVAISSLLLTIASVMSLSIQHKLIDSCQRDEWEDWLIGGILNPHPPLIPSPRMAFHFPSHHCLRHPDVPSSVMRDCVSHVALSTAHHSTGCKVEGGGSGSKQQNQCTLPFLASNTMSAKAFIATNDGTCSRDLSRTARSIIQEKGKVASRASVAGEAFSDMKVGHLCLARLFAAADG